jgi:hypothetical protein
MATFAVPTIVGPSNLEWGIDTNTWAFVSPLTKSTQTIEMPGARWVITLGWQDLPMDIAPVFEGFIASLRGKSNRFTSHNFYRPIPRGTLRGTPTVVGSHSKGVSSISLQTTASATLLAGDFIGVNGELKMVRADVTASGAGAMTVTVEPPLRNALSNAMPITWDRPTARFILDDNLTRWRYRDVFLTGLTVAGTEDW